MPMFEVSQISVLVNPMGTFESENPEDVLSTYKDGRFGYPCWARAEPMDKETIAEVIEMRNLETNEITRKVIWRNQEVKEGTPLWDAITIQLMKLL